MALKNFTQFTPYTVLSSTDNFVGYRDLDEIRSDLSSVTDAISGLLISKGFTPGSSVGVVRKASYRYTIASGSSLNAVSGADDYGLVLSYQPTQVEVYRNGAHLAEILDFVATTGNQITNLSALNTGDIVEVVALSSTVLNLVGSISGSGDALATTFRYSVASSNTIKPGNTLIAGVDDFGLSLGFTVPNLEVYLNGSHLVRDLDYGSYNSGTALTLNEAVADGDTVEVVSVSAYNLSQVVGISSYAGIQRIQAGKDFSISNITGTGVVTLSAKPGIRDIKVPDWTTGAHITNWSTLQLYLSSVASSNRFTQASAVSMRVFGTTRGYSVSMQVHPNGKIYMFPADSSQTTHGYVIDPNNETIITTFFHSGGVSRAMLAPNGKFYMPGLTTRLIVLDPSTNTVNQTINTSPFSFDYPTLARNGKFYEPKRNSLFTGVQFFDPVAETSGSFSTLLDSTLNFNGLQLAPNGKIYTIPYRSTLFTVIDPEAGTSSTYGFAGGFSYSGLPRFSVNFEGSVLAPNGKIYCIPHNVTSSPAGVVTDACIGIINPDDNTTTTFSAWISNGTAGANAQTAFLAPNGKIYTSPNQDSFVVCIDPDTNTATKLIGNTIGFSSLQGQGGVMHPNGKAFFVPYYSTGIGVMYFNINNNFNINVCTNPMFNKQT